MIILFLIIWKKLIRSNNENFLWLSLVSIPRYVVIVILIFVMDYLLVEADSSPSSRAVLPFRRRLDRRAWGSWDKPSGSLWASWSCGPLRPRKVRRLRWSGDWVDPPREAVPGTRRGSSLRPWRRWRGAARRSCGPCRGWRTLAGRKGWQGSFGPPWCWAREGPWTVLPTAGNLVGAVGHGSTGTPRSQVPPRQSSLCSPWHSQ